MNLGLSGRNASTVPTSDPSTTGPQGFPTDPGWKDSWQKIFKIFIGPALNTDVSYGKLSLWFDPDVIQIKLYLLVQIIDLFLTVSM